MSLSDKPAFEFLESSSLTARLRTIEHVDVTTLCRLGSFGKFVLSSSSDEPIYCDIASPQGTDTSKFSSLDLVLDLMFV